MRWLKATCRNVFRREVVDSDLEEEIRSYRQLLEDEKITAGADPAVARREAAVELGGIEMIKDEVRDVRRGSSVEGSCEGTSAIGSRSTPESEHGGHGHPHAGPRHRSQHHDFQRI